MINPTIAKRDQNLISLYRKTAQANIKVVRKTKECSRSEKVLWLNQNWYNKVACFQSFKKALLKLLNNSSVS